MEPEDFDYTMNMINTTLTDFWPCCLCFTFGYVEEYRRTCPVVVCVSVCARMSVCCVHAGVLPVLQSPSTSMKRINEIECRILPYRSV